MHAKYADVLPTAEIIAHLKTLPDDLFPNLPRGAAPAATGSNLRLVSSA